jgi:hypothetical protein
MLTMHTRSTTGCRPISGSVHVEVRDPTEFLRLVLMMMLLGFKLLPEMLQHVLVESERF